jgi:hypothetical protein
MQHMHELFGQPTHIDIAIDIAHTRQRSLTKQQQQQQQQSLSITNNNRKQNTTKQKTRTSSCVNSSPRDNTSPALAALNTTPINLTAPNRLDDALDRKHDDDSARRRRSVIVDTLCFASNVHENAICLLLLYGEGGFLF